MCKDMIAARGGRGEREAIRCGSRDKSNLELAVMIKLELLCRVGVADGLVIVCIGT